MMRDHETLKEEQLMTSKTPFPVVRLQRTISASPHEVYRAWLEPALLRQWMAPGLEVKRGFECEIVELVPDQRLVFRWGFVGPERAAGPVYDSRLTITLGAAKGNATTLTLVHERLDDLAAAMPDAAANVGPGWALVLEKLALLFEGHRRQATASGQHA